MIKSILIAAAVAVGTALSAQPLRLSLKEAEKQALEHSYAMVNAEMDISASEREVKEVLAQGLPQVDANLEYQQLLQIPVQLIPGEFLGLPPGEFAEVQFGLEYNLTGNITASQLLFDGTYFVGLRAAKTALELTANAKVKTADNTRRYMDISMKTLNFLMGIGIDVEVELTDKIEELVQLNNNAAFLQRDHVLDRHPDIRIARTNVVVQELTVQGAQAAYYPRLNMFLNHQQNAQRRAWNFAEGGRPWFPATILGVTMDIPIFSGFERKNNVQRSKIELDRSQVNLTQAEENLRLEQRRAMVDYENAMKVWETQKQSTALAERINERTSTKYKEGVSSSTDLNVARTQMLNEQGKYVDAALKLLTAKQQLDKAFNLFED
ncbi:MAG: TolC family protein [Flavobacteriales bacterium]|nr:TolC family protein [Flavobacteriales bacterium]